MGNYLQGAAGAEEGGGGDDDHGGQQPQPMMMLSSPHANANNNDTDAAPAAPGSTAAAAPAAPALVDAHGGGGLHIETQQDGDGGSTTTGAGGAATSSSAWTALLGGGFSCRGNQSPAHAAAQGPTPRAPTRYRVLPRGVQGLWAFGRAVEVTLQRRGYDDQLWAGLEAGWEGAEGEGGDGSKSSSSSTATTTTTTVVSSSGAVVGVGVKRRQPGAEAAAAAAGGRPGQRRPPLPAQLLPAILRWADVCKEVTLLKMEDVHVANGDHVYLRYAIPEALHGYKVVAALVVVQAHDQGWSSFPQDHGTTRGSCTWGDVVVESPQRETTCSRPHVAAAAELYRNLHAVRRWQTHVARLEDYGVGEGQGKGVEGEEEGERGRRAMIGGEEEATPPSSPGHAHPPSGAQDGEGQEQEQESEEAREAREARQRAADRVAVVRALTPGATLCLRLSARYPGWVHFVRHASITVRFMRDE